MESINHHARTTKWNGPPFGRAVRRALALALAVLGVLAVSTAPAQAGPVGTYSLPTWQNVHTGRCLADSFGGGLQTLACIDHPTQRWEDATPSASTYRYRNSHTNRCLADSFGGGLQTLACANHPTQDWDWATTGGIWVLQNSHTDRCLADSFGGGLQTLACANPLPNTQLWR